VEIAYTGINFSGNETLTLNLYEMDGGPTPGSFGFNTPGTLLFTQTVPVSAGDLIALFEDASGTVLLPDYIGIGLIFEGIGGIVGVPNTEDAGPRLFDPPDIGSSFDDYWLLGFPDSTDDWALFQLANEIPANFGARITAVPEPSALMLLTLAFAGFIRCRRRCKR
jgi:hypothetical protein